MSIHGKVRTPLDWKPTTDGIGETARDAAGRAWNVWSTGYGTWRASVDGRVLSADADRRTGRARPRGWRSRIAAVLTVEDIARDTLSAAPVSRADVKP